MRSVCISLHIALVVGFISNIDGMVNGKLKLPAELEVPGKDCFLLYKCTHRWTSHRNRAIRRPEPLDGHWWCRRPLPGAHRIAETGRRTIENEVGKAVETWECWRGQRVALQIRLMLDYVLNLHSKFLTPTPSLESLEGLSINNFWQGARSQWTR